MPLPATSCLAFRSELPQVCIFGSELWPVKLSSHFLQAVFGIFTFVAGGIWTGFRFLPGVPTILGFIFVSAVVLFPVSAGAAIIRRQLRLPRHSN